MSHFNNILTMLERFSNSVAIMSHNGRWKNVHVLFYCEPFATMLWQCYCESFSIGHVTL